MYSVKVYDNGTRSKPVRVETVGSIIGAMSIAEGIAIGSKRYISIETDSKYAMIYSGDKIISQPNQIMRFLANAKWGKPGKTKSDIDAGYAQLIAGKELGRLTLTFRGRMR